MYVSLIGNLLISLKIITKNYSTLETFLHQFMKMIHGFANSNQTFIPIYTPNFFPHNESFHSDSYLHISGTWVSICSRGLLYSIILDFINNLEFWQFPGYRGKPNREVWVFQCYSNWGHENLDFPKSPTWCFLDRNFFASSNFNVRHVNFKNSPVKISYITPSPNSTSQDSWGRQCLRLFHHSSSRNVHESINLAYFETFS